MQPTRKTLLAIAVDRGISVADHYLDRAVADHAGLRSRVDRLRSIQLPFLHAVEPADAFEWIERRGHSRT